MFDSHPRQQRPLLGAAGCGEYLGAGSLSQLHGCQTHTARGGVDENAFTALHPRQPVQPVLGSKERNRNRRRGLAAQRRRPDGHQVRRRRHVRTQAAAGHAEHVVADVQMRDIAAGGDHRADAFSAERAGVAWVHSQSVQHIAEIQSGMCHPHFDLIRTGVAARGRLEVQVVEHAAFRGLERERLLPHLAGTHSARDQPGDVDAPAAQSDLRFLAWIGNQWPDLRGFRAVARTILEIDAGALQLGMLRRHGSSQSPDRRVRCIEGLDVTDRLGTTRHDPHPGAADVRSKQPLHKVQ